MKNRLWKILCALGLSAALLTAAGCGAKEPESPAPTQTQAQETPRPTEVIDSEDILTEDDIPVEDEIPEEEDSETLLDEEIIEEETGFVPGTYTGEGTGNNGIVKVDVTVDEERILAVNVTEHGETAGISDPAFETLPGAILAAQSADVDAVAGATMTSQAIMDAVNAALEQAAN